MVLGRARRGKQAGRCSAAGADELPWVARAAAGTESGPHHHLGSEDQGPFQDE
jgi:hypothetical protein